MPSAVFWPGIGGGTAHYRCQAPGNALERLGWDVGYVEDESSSLDADVVVLQRVAVPGIAELVTKLQRHGKTVVYDIDDWYDGIPAYNPASGHVAPILDELHEAMRRADLITCSTPELAEGYARFGPTTVLPNYLDPDVWAQTKSMPRAKIHVGWMGHFEYRSADLDLLRPWLRDWLDAHPEVRFVVCGSRETLDYLHVDGLASPPTRAGGYLRPYDHLPRMLSWLDVGLAPLAFNRFNQAKSWCKAMEYGAAGATVVASPSREYRAYVRPGRNGYLVRHQQWQTALDKTLDRLDDLKAGARQTAEEHMIDRHIHRWVQAWAQVACRVA